MIQEDFMTSVSCFTLGAIEFSGLPLPPGETHVSIASRVMGLSLDEAARVFSHSASDRRAFRIGRLVSYAILRRGSLVDLPPLAELICEFDFEGWVQKQIFDDRIDILVELHCDLQRV